MDKFIGLSKLILPKIVLENGTVKSPNEICIGDKIVEQCVSKHPWSSKQGPPIPNPLIPLFTFNLSHQLGANVYNVYETNQISIPDYSYLKKHIHIDLTFCDRPILRQLKKLNLSEHYSKHLKLKIFYGDVDLPNTFSLVIKIYPNKCYDNVFFSTCKNNRGSINGQFMSNMDNKIIDLVTKYPGQRLLTRQPINDHFTSQEMAIYHKYLYTVQFDI